MNFDKRNSDASQRISNRYTCVRICSSVDNDGHCAVCTSRVDTVHNDAFVIRLKPFKVKAELIALSSSILLDIRERFASVPVWSV